MVGSHADEVEGGEPVVRARCEAMAQAVHAEMGRYRAAQEQELAELLSTQSRSEAAEQRVGQLERVLSQPLRLSATAVAVSAKTGQGFEELQRILLDTAFDKEAFPTFGSSQPGTYSAIHRKLLRAHPEQSSVVSIVSNRRLQYCPAQVRTISLTDMSVLAANRRGRKCSSRRPFSRSLRAVN
jgi:hypothetical protein